MSGFLKFLAGVVVGGAAVALLTPTTGDDLRARIKDTLRRKGLIADEKLDDVVEMIAAELEEK
ncbi:MAG: YtxH domain-containing protein [Muribaculaceae bacterium]|nr:YtxH domain-containing protein [Muribaculaceae bacterium]MDE7458542.1 YtxH domain-containing protein [Muribaculaceae bacterium]